MIRASLSQIPPSCLLVGSFKHIYALFSTFEISINPLNAFAEHVTLHPYTLGKV